MATICGQTSDQTKILVMNTTDAVGAPLARLLVEQGRPVRVVAREPVDARPLDGAEVFRGDMTSADDAASALRSVRRAFLEIPDDNGAAFVAAAAGAGLEHVVLLSSFSTFVELPSGSANVVRERYRTGEQVLTSAKLPCTFLRCAGFDDDILRWTSAIGEGVVRAPFADVALPRLDPGDVAASAAAILAASPPEPGAYVLTGPEQISTRQAVAVLSAVLGRPLALEQLSSEEAMGYFRADTPELLRRSLLETLGEAASALAPTTDVEHLTGRPPRSFRDWATDHVGLFAQWAHAC